MMTIYKFIALISLGVIVLVKKEYLYNSFILPLYGDVCNHAGLEPTAILARKIIAECFRLNKQFGSSHFKVHVVAPLEISDLEPKIAAALAEKSTFDIDIEISSNPSQEEYSIVVLPKFDIKAEVNNHATSTNISSNNPGDLFDDYSSTADLGRVVGLRK